MYKLKRVELLGFKSFANRTRLDFGDGIAGVVGPNGCGKSNLSDAISWVLGEQSAKSLRGERMMDVIFSGTSARPSTGMAEVSLTLIDPEYMDALPDLPASDSPIDPAIESAAVEAEGGGNGHGNGNGNGRGSSPSKIQHRAGEIVVTRRLFRSGESEYLINNEICRLRDIQDLFMGTGLGPESYAIIEQGRIGQILSSKPSDRRLIIEEAAGVSKFKTRKRLAEAKLETSRANLARVADILEEVTKQVNSLKRQASKARRFREMQEELRGRLKITLTSRLRTLETECRRWQDEVAALAVASAEVAKQLEQVDQAQKSAAARYDELEGQLYELRTAIAQQEIDRERLAARIEQLRQQSVGLEARTGEAAGEIQVLEAQLSALDAEKAEKTRQAALIEHERGTAQETHSALTARLEELTNRITHGEAAAEAGRQELLASVSQLAELRNQLVQASEVGLGLERQASRFYADIAVVEQLHGRLAAELEGLCADHERGMSTLSGLVESVQSTTDSLERSRREEANGRAEVDALRQEFSTADARKRALEESLARHSYSTESVRRLLAGDGNGFRPKGLLADFVEVAPGYEEVVEEYLKAELDCIVVERHDDARSGISLLKSEGTGRSTFFVTRAPGNGHGNGHHAEEVRQQAGVLASVRDLVRLAPELGLNGDLPFPALAGAYVVEDAEAAERLAASYPDFHFLTATGEHYHHRLVTGGKGKSAGPLALRRDFRDLERRVVELESHLRTGEAAWQDASTRVASLDAELRRLSEIKSDAEKQAVVSDQKLQQIRDAHERAGERLRVLRSEAATVANERAGNQTAQATLREKLESAATERRERETQVNRVTSEVRDLRFQLDTLNPELAEAQTRLAGLEERTRSFQNELARISVRGEEIRERCVHLRAQTQGWTDELQLLAEERTLITAQLADLEAAYRAAREGLQVLELESQTVRARRDELTPAIEDARAALEARREKKSEAEITLARIQSDHSHHLEQCRQKLHTDPLTLLAELPPEQALTDEALAQAEAEAKEIETKIENLGPVNMMALEELQEAEERYTFLETQRQDLLASIEDTAQAIREIDQVSRQQFLEAFKSINGYFAEAFKVLFGGGVGEMRLSDESDADSGIDIVAQPPGKRLQNILLLSGGEKALAALALLISMFRYTPSPFCILDEVDAPLDESNVRRFTQMIQQMSRHTQFILITHNKRTMEIAKVLYGVTMEDPGVSRLVSVRFDEAEPETEEVAVLA